MESGPPRGAGAEVSTSSLYSVHPRAEATLRGAIGNRFAIVSNGSGATITPATGVYVAGRLGGAVDLVSVTDGSGAKKFIRVEVGAGVHLDPADTAVAPSGIVRIAASGGSGIGFAFQLTTNASGGTIDAQTGVYRAGPQDQTVDELTVTDSLGNTAASQIVVGDGVVVSPSSAAAPPGGVVAFSASGGGAAQYLFTFENNRSGGTLDPNTGAYTAGRVGNVIDEVSVVDAFGNWVKVPVNVGEGIALSTSMAVLPTLGTSQFSSRGGSGNGVRFTLSTNASGGTIDPETGAYTAGSIANVSDQVTVTDDVGNTATAVVRLARN